MSSRGQSGPRPPRGGVGGAGGFPGRSSGPAVAAAVLWLAAGHAGHGLPAVGREVPGEELGLPLVRHYSHHDYGVHPQNWAVLQTSDGRMLFGNTDGVLEYDGVRWRLLHVDNSSIVRSLAEGDGTVYVGAVGELGYLERDAAGALTYISLVLELPLEHRDFGDVWGTWASSDGICFWTVGKLFRWHRQRFDVFEFDSHQVPALVGGRIYSNDPVDGLKVLRGDAFESVEGGELLAGVRVFRMLPYEEGTMLVGSRSGELFLFSSPSLGGAAVGRPPRLEPFTTGADDGLRRHGLYGAAALADGGFALGTRSGGVFVVDRGGGLRFRLDKSLGLRDDSVWAAATDREGGLWLGLNRGLARVEVSSPFTVFGEAYGLDGSVEEVTRHAGALAIATSAGAYVFDGGRFVALAGTGSPCWSLLPAGDRLLVGCNDGVHAFGLDAGRPVRRSFHAFELYAPPSRPGVAFVGEAGGLGVLRYEDGAWVDGGRIEGVDERVRSIAEDREGRVWLGTQYRGVVRLTFRPRSGGQDTGLEVGEVRRFGLEDGLPILEGVKVHRLPGAGDLLFGTADGLYRFDETGGRFEPDPRFRDATAGRGVLRLASQGDDRLWLSGTHRQGLARLHRQGGSWHLDDVLFRRLPGRIFYALYPEPSGATWLGGVEGLFRFDPAGETFDDVGFAVTVAAYAGAGQLPAAGEVTLPYADNSLTFHFAAASFHDETATIYSYRLEGFDAGDSAWTGDARKEYTNLPPGKYRFRVRARNVYGTESEAAAWGFAIRPPWYRTAPAYLAYLLAAGLAVTALVRWRSRELEREKSALELEVTARTRELQESERKLRMAVEGARMAAWSWNMQTDEVDGAEQMAEVLGLDPGEFGGTGQAYRKVVHPDDARRYDRVLAAAARESGGDYEVEHRILRPDGSVGWIFGKGRVLCDESGRPLTMTGIVSDVTERKRGDAERERLFAELEAQHAELERFTYTVSHDLKSPLVTIGGFLGLLEKDLEAGAKDRVRTDLERIRSAVGRMRRLLDELLELSRIGRLTNSPEAVPVAELVAEATELVAVDPRDAGLTVGTDLPAVYGDRTQLLQVFQNLLDNAVRFLGDPSSPRIEVGARCEDPWVVCWVADNGIGIDPSYHDKVFGLFERLDPNVEGTGIGLALVKRVVEHHGGRIWVESEGRGRGSTFFFTLPAVPPSALGEANRDETAA